MKFTFDQTTEDILDLSKNSLGQNKVFKMMGIFFLIVLLINIVSTTFMVGFKPQALLSWVIPILILVVLWSVLFKFLLKRRFSKPGTKEMVLGQRIIQLLDDGIMVETPVSNTTYKWTAVTKLGESDLSYFLYLGPAEALIIPKRAVTSPNDNSTLEKFVKERIVNMK